MSKKPSATHKPPESSSQPPSPKKGRPGPKKGQSRAETKPRDPHLVEVGARIRSLREAKHLPKSELAAHLQVTVGAVTQWELGYVRLSMTNLDELVTILGTNRQFLLTGDNSDELRKAQDILEMEALTLLRRIPTTTKRAEALLEIAKIAGAEVTLEKPPPRR